MTTFDHLTTVRKEGIKTSELFFEQQVRERNPALFDNSSMWVKDAFELGLLYWGHNEVRETIRCFELCLGTNRLRLEQYRLLRDIPTAKKAFEDGSGQPEHLARLAGYFIGERVEKARSDAQADDEQPGYEPWFELTFIDACIDGSQVDAAAFERSKQLWVERRFPAAKLAEWDFYREVLEGGWSLRAPDEMLQQHAKLYAKRAKSKGSGDLMSGEGQFNDLVVDFIFAAILKRIGWKGQYRHSWPENGIVPAPGSRPTTTTKPTIFFRGSGSGHSSSEMPKSGAELSSDEILSAIEGRIPIGARRLRTEKNNEIKVGQSLEALGIGHDLELTEIARRYRLADFVSPRENAGSLSDPVEMVEWTKYFRTHHGMSDKFVLLSAPMEIAEWEEPESSQFVYCVSDAKVYLADVEDLADPSSVAAQAQPGISVWPSLGAFLLWYLGVAAKQSCG